MIGSELLAAVSTGWGWTGIQPRTIAAVSPFGHIVIEDVSAVYWYLDPEMRALTRIADDPGQLFAYMNDPEIREIWQAETLVDAARTRLGEPGEGHCYTLEPLALLKGDYSPDNLCILPIAELIHFSGDVERQIKDLPEGSTFQLKVPE